MAMIKYRLWESRFRDWTDPMGWWPARRRARLWLRHRNAPFTIGGKKAQNVRECLRRMERLTKQAEVNGIVDVVASGGWRMVIRKVQIDTRGDIIAHAALSQLGVDYVWGAEDAGDGFDCSGLTRWAYAQVGSELPHNAEQQRQLASTFVLRDRIKPGDLVFYHTGRLPPGVADHVGICVNKYEVCDASSGLDQVVHRDIDANPVLCFGRIISVNGPL